MKTTHFNKFVLFNTEKFDIKTLLESDLARLAFMATLMSIGLYLLQYFNFVG